MDLTPTFLDLTGATYPDIYNGRPMVPFLSKKSSIVLGPDEAIGWEFNNFKATWTGKPFGPSEWQVFDLSVDPGESKDLSSQKPKLKLRFIDAWNEYATSAAVIPPDVSSHADK